MSNKISIRFYNDREVRAVWDEEENKWYYSATDIVRAINNEPDYVKAGNYWRWLKKKLTSQHIQLVSDIHDFKLVSPDGKKRHADVLDDQGVQLFLSFRRIRTANVIVWYKVLNITKIVAKLFGCFDFI